MKLKVESFVCNPFQERCYLVYEEQTLSCLVIDPGMCSEYEWSRVKNYIELHSLIPKAVLLTHCHCDHVIGTAFLTRQYPGLPIYGSLEDQNHLPSVQSQMQMFGVDTEIHWSPITINLSEGDQLSLFANSDEDVLHPILVIDVPGHSHHGLCYYFPNDRMLFSGDVLFYCSVGRSDFGASMGGNGRQLVEGIVQKLLSLPQSTVVYPGHGPNTSIENETTYNPFL